MTGDPRLMELIQADLDGRLDGAGKAELARRLLADPEARRFQQELRHTDTLLRDLPRAEPPEGLRPAIQEALGLSDHHRGGRREADGGVGFRLAAAVVAGLVIVGLGYGLLGERRDMAALQGSVVQPPSASTLADEAALRFGPGAVTVRMYREGTSGTRLTLESSGLEDVKVVGQYDPLTLTPRSGLASNGQAGRFSVTLPGEGGIRTLEFAGIGAVRLEVTGGGEPPRTVALDSDAKD